MGNRNAEHNAQAYSLPKEARTRAWALAFVLLCAAFALALAFAMPSGVAFADDEAANLPAASNDRAANSGESTSAGNSDASLTPTDSGGLKTQDDAATEPKPDDPQPEPAVLITVSIISRDGAARQTFQIEKGKTISFVDGQGEVLIQYTAAESSITEPVAPTKSGYDFTGWSVRINDEGNAVITPQYQETTPSAPASTTDDVKTVRSVNGVVTTNSPKTGDLLSLAAPLAIAGVALIAMLALLFTRRRN